MDGYNTEEQLVIKTAVRLKNDMVMVFDETGEQIPEYQGQYDMVKGNILRDASPEAVFSHGIAASGRLLEVSRENW
jgi:hypothetical protein